MINMPWKLLINIITLGIPPIIKAIAAARRAKREQEQRLAAEQRQRQESDIAHKMILDDIQRKAERAASDEITHRDYTPDERR